MKDFFERRNKTVNIYIGLLVIDILVSIYYYAKVHSILISGIIVFLVCIFYIIFGCRKSK